MKIPFSADAAPAPAKPSCLKVTEQYFCVEGEGSTLGALTWLVRLSGCNLRCWWCDSKQSSFYNDEEKMLPASAIEKAALKSGAHWISFTGGEPAWRSPEELMTLASLCVRLRMRGLKVKIESNGLLQPAALKSCVDLWSIAPKWDGSKQFEAQQTAMMRYDLGSLKALARSHAPAAMQLKFVISYDSAGSPRPGDLKRAAVILRGLQGPRRPPVFFIPEAYAKGDYLQRCKKLESAVAKLALRLKGWDIRVQPQWHRVMYGDERGR